MQPVIKAVQPVISAVQILNDIVRLVLLQHVMAAMYAKEPIPQQLLIGAHQDQAWRVSQVTCC